MNAEQKIRQALKGVYDEGRVNAMTVRKGFAVDTHMTGWHVQEFGRSNHTFLGNSVAEALEAIDEIAECRQ